MSILKMLGFGSSATNRATTAAERDTVRKIVDELDHMEPERARFIAAFAYVLGRVAHADLSVSEQETRSMETIVQKLGGLPEEQAILVVQMAKTMSLELADLNIRVNTISPGGTATDRLAFRFGDLEEAEKVWGPKHPIGRLGRPEEIANGAVFLASDESSFMTGADLLIDGGYAAQ